MSDVVLVALISAVVFVFGFVFLRLFQAWTARNQERVKSDDNPNNDDAYDDLAADLADDTKEVKR